MSYTQLGTFTGMYGLLAMMLSVPAGVSARSASARSRCSALGLLGVAAGSVLLGEAWSTESAIAFRGLTIFGYRFAFVSVLIAVALTAPPALRGRTMGVVGATSSLASVIGAPLGGILVREFTWRDAILGYAAMAALGAALFWWFYRPAPDSAPRSREGHAVEGRGAQCAGVAGGLAPGADCRPWRVRAVHGHVLRAERGAGGLQSRCRCGWHHHQHRLSGRHRGEPRCRLARGSVQQGARAGRRVRGAGDARRVADRRASPHVPRGDGHSDRVRLYGSEPALRASRAA